MGGLARRAQMIETLRKSEPSVLLLDCGAVFDDKKDAAELQLQAMELMGYDALNLGSPEFIFGKEFLEQERSHVSFPYIASNLLYGGSRLPWTLEYLIKEVSGIRVAVLGILDPDGLTRLPGQERVKGLEAIPPEAALNRLLSEVRGKADLVILLSQFDVTKTLALVKAVRGVDVAISSGNDVFFAPATEKETTVLLQTGSQGKVLGLLKLTFDEKRRHRITARRYVPLDNSVPDNGAIGRLVEPFKKAPAAEQDQIGKERMDMLKLNPKEFMERYRKEQSEQGKGEAR